MELGIFARTFSRPTLEDTLNAVKATDLSVVQLNLSCAGLPTLPENLPEEAADRIGAAIAARGIKVAALSGTFNMAHPDVGVREAGLRGLRVLGVKCRRLGTSLITLCTGTRDPSDMWRHHRDNASPDAWRDMTACVRAAVQIAEDCDITLAFEPETANVVDGSQRGRRLLDEIGSSRLKIVLDGANLFHPGRQDAMRETLEHAFELLGGDLALLHAKELPREAGATAVECGQGALDFHAYLSLARGVSYHGPLIIHGVAEEQVPGSIGFLRGVLARSGD